MTATELLRRLVRMLDDDNPDYEDSGRLWDEARAFLAQPQLPEPGLREALLDVLNLKHNAFDKQGFPCACKTHERARAALAAPAAQPALDVERLVAALERIKRSAKGMTPDTMNFDMGVAAAQDALRVYARLAAQEGE